MKNINRNISVFPSNVTTINFCGKPIMWQMDCRIYEPPYETEPTPGEHDFNTCEGCLKNLKILREDFSERFNGTKEKQGFPLCCEAHAELAKLQVFNRNHFNQVPDWTAKKIIYTKQHIKNHIFADDYYQEITDYIDYTIDSFGQTPNDSEPLYLGSYLSCISGIISKGDDIPKDRKKKLMEYLGSYKAPKKKSQTDFNVLIGTYEKWFKIFPWEMSFFAPLKPQFEKLPIIQSASPVNKYSGKVIAKPHTKSSLIEMLLKTTDSILTQINSLALYEKGLLTDPQKIGIELVCNERRLKIKQGYTNASPDEGQRYRNILKDWFADEKKFIEDMTKYLPAPQQKILPPATSDNKMEEFHKAMEAKGYRHSPELQKILDDAIAGEKAKNPYWPTNAPFSCLSKDDEDMDALLMAGKFEINACLTSYYREIKRYKIDELLNKIGIGAKGLFEILNNLCGGIKDNTDRPIYVQNTITDIIKFFDDYPGCGQVIQILILQGLLSWFESCDINKGDKGCKAAEDLCDWVGEQSMKVCTFYFIHFNKDENSKPLDDYLATTEIGKAWEQFSHRSTGGPNENGACLVEGTNSGGNAKDNPTATKGAGFSHYLLSDIHKLCNDKLFVQMEVNVFQSIINNPQTANHIIQIKHGEKARAYHLIYKLGTFISSPDECRSWRTSLLTHLGIKESTYNSKYKEVENDDLNDKNISFKSDLDAVLNKNTQN